MSASRKYVLISPCRDEARFLATTIEAVAAQTVLPTCWLIVDDGSTDGTSAILEEAAKRYPFIRVVRREDRGVRSVGPGVVDAFYHGLAQLDLGAYDYLCKFDCDLDLPARYFERCLEEFEGDPWLGTFSGKLYGKHADGLVLERTGDENSVGPVKLYRTACFQEIGGFAREVCWDGIDGHACRLNGWIAASRDGDDLRIIHLRQMGSSHKNVWVGRKRWGKGKYFMGSAPYYMVAVAGYRMLERPFVVGGVGILWGYLQALWRKEPRLDRADYRDAIKRFERDALLRGKSEAARVWNERVRQGPPKVERKNAASAGAKPSPGAGTAS
jgi:poly-beta-1,6-N-acetyl-D-glucosamine synthase